jgi:hypothetical protein
MWQKILVAKRKQSHQIFQSQRVVEGSGMEIAQQQIKVSVVASFTTT